MVRVKRHRPLHVIIVFGRPLGIICLELNYYGSSVQLENFICVPLIFYLMFLSGVIRVARKTLFSRFPAVSFIITSARNIFCLCRRESLCERMVT